MKIIATILIIVISFFIYSSLHTQLSYTPHTWYGYFFGILGSVLIILSSTYALRKRYLKIYWGPLNSWYSWHIYLGWIALFFILFHCDYKVRGKIPTILFILFLSILASGYLFILIWKIQGFQWKNRERIDPEAFHRGALDLFSYFHFFLFLLFFLFLILHIGFSLPRTAHL